MVNNEYDYIDSRCTVLNSEAYDLLKEGPAASVGRKIKKIPLQIKVR